MSVEYFPTEQMWPEVLTKPMQLNSYIIMRRNLINMHDFYVKTDDNSQAKWSKASGVSANDK